jgi:hypothetical protein
LPSQHDRGSRPHDPRRAPHHPRRHPHHRSRRPGGGVGATRIGHAVTFEKRNGRITMTGQGNLRSGVQIQAEFGGDH